MRKLNLSEEEKVAMVVPSASKLRHFLNLYWLRPENGLMSSFKSQAFADVELDGPSLDISCGDGLFMYIHAGGRLTEDSDFFVSTSAQEFKHGQFVDIYDSYDKDYRIVPEKSPDYRLDCGTDWKKSLLDKAAHLDLYDKLVHHDNNVTPLPLKGEEYQTIYSNSVYWVRQVEPLVKDVYRMLRPGGIAVLEVATPTLLETLDQLTPILGEQATSILDRERRASTKGFQVPAQWEKIFKRTGFAIEDARCVWPNKLLTDIWNVGLRPVSHLLIQMVKRLDHEERLRIKQEWVDIFFTLFKPLLDLPLTYEHERAPYISYILRK